LKSFQGQKGGQALLAYMRLLYICGQPYIRPESSEANKNKMDSMVGPCWKEVGPKISAALGVPFKPTASGAEIVTIMNGKDVSKLANLMDEEDRRFLACVDGIHPTTGDQVLERASEFVGRVSSMDRGDHKKFGYLVMQKIYSVVDKLDPKYLASLANQGNNPKGGPWSWCGIFVTFCSSAMNKDLKWGMGGVMPKRPATLTLPNAKPGDMIHWRAQNMHMSMFVKVEDKGDKKMVHSVDGNGWAQGVAYNMRESSQVAGLTKLTP